MAKPKPLTTLMRKSGKRLAWERHMRTLYDAWVGQLDDGEYVEVTLARHGQHKTNTQLAYWYGVLMPFAVEELRGVGYDTLFQAGVKGVQTSVETNVAAVDLLFKCLFQAFKGLDAMPQKRDLSAETMGELIDFTLRWLAENLGVVAPTPEMN